MQKSAKATAISWRVRSSSSSSSSEESSESDMVDCTSDGEMDRTLIPRANSSTRPAVSKEEMEDLVDDRSSSTSGKTECLRADGLIGRKWW